MAEIKIEKKKPVWPWIVVGLILLLLLYFFWYSNRSDIHEKEEIDFRDTLASQRDIVDDQALPLYKNDGNYQSQYQEYNLFLEDAQHHPDANKSDFHREALLKLIKAVREQSDISNVDVERNLEVAEENAEKVTHDVHNAAGVQVKKAAEEITVALKKIQKNSFEVLEKERENLEEVVSDLNGMRVIEEQQNQILVFHRKAKDLLQKMNEPELKE